MKDKREQVFPQYKDVDTQKVLQLAQREGISLEKGVILTEEFCKQNEQLITDYANFFTAYPDLFLDLITPLGSNFSLFFYQRIILRAIMRYKEVFITACLKGNTPILTEKGMIQIKDFNPNLKVWSNGDWRNVENLNIRNWNGELVRLSGENCFEDTITVTDNHKFLVVKRKNENSRPGKFWKEGLDFFNIKNYDNRKEFFRKALREIQPEYVEAKDLKKTDWFLSEIDLKVKDIFSLKLPAASKKTINIINKDKITLDNEFYEWLGIWLAEGSWKKSTISFTININEKRLANRIKTLTKHIFNLETSTYFRKDKNTQIISIQSAHLSDFLKKLFNCDSDEINQWNKWIPEKLLHCSPSKQLQLVKGWLDGDGHFRKTKNCYRYKGTTVSNLLVEGIKFILYRNFVNPSITTEERKNKSKVYNINFNGLLAKEFEDSIEEERPVIIYEDMRLGEYYPKKFGNKLYMINKVRDVKILPPDNEDVYCLQLNNETFNINGVEGHNCRAFSKSFISILGIFLQCIFIPGTKRFICAPNKNQAAQIAKEKIIEIYEKFPLLKKEVIGGEISDTPGNFGKDYVTIKFRNGSQFDVVGALDSQRGGRRNGGLIDEIRDHDETALNEIVLPLMNVSRRLPDNTVNDKEPNQQVLCMTSAGVKTSFGYDKLIDIFENSIIDPENSFVFGCDYRIPVMHGLLDKTYVNKLKMSPSYNEESFAREYMSIWSGSSDDSWFNFDKMQKYRKIKNPEVRASSRQNANEFYLLSVDVGRLNDQTVCCVFRVNVIQGKYYATLVNLFVLGLTPEAKTFSQQAIQIKKIISQFNPREVVIDTNGLGVGIGDEMIRTQIGDDGTYYPAYGFSNDDNYKKIQPHDAPQILYGIKANGPLNSQIHGNAYSRINSGKVRFLIKEQEAKSALLATKIGQKMSTEERVKRLMPHELTTRLFEEMANLRLKRTGASMDIVLEQINNRFPKDKYSAFAYGLWRIKELEELEAKKTRRRSGRRTLIFYSGG